MKQLSLDTLRTFVSVIELGGYAKAGDFLGCLLYTSDAADE